LAAASGYFSESFVNDTLVFTAEFAFQQLAANHAGRVLSCSPLSAAQWLGKNPDGQGQSVEILRMRNTAALIVWLGAAA
jgi:hypothetical protein